jgi:hypothetical protein
MIKPRRMRCRGHVAYIVEKRNAYRFLVGKTEGKKPSGKPRYWWKNDIKVDLKEVELKGWDWINLAQDRDKWWGVLNTVWNLEVL